MNIVKPKYSYADLCKIENRAKQVSNEGKLSNPVTWICVVMNFINIGIVLYCLHCYLKKFMDVLYYIYSMVSSNLENVANTTVIFLSSIVYFLIGGVIVITLMTVLGMIPKIFQWQMIKLGILKPYLLKNTEFHRLITVYSHVESILELSEEELDAAEITKIEDGISVRVKKNGYIETVKCFFFEYTKEICKDNCLNFAVLDPHVDNILRNLDGNLSSFLPSSS